MDQVKEVIDHIKTALGPLPWEDKRFCEICEFELRKNEEEFCSYCKDQ